MKKCSFIVSVVALILPLGVLADSHEEELPSLSDVWIMVPKQGMEGQFESAIQAHMAARAEGEDSRNWAGFRVVLGHNLNMYQWRYCCFDWADQDAYLSEEQEKGFNAHWSENVHQYVDHYHHYLENTDRENSNWPEDEPTGPYYGVTTRTWKQGAGPGPNEARKKLSQLALNEGWAEEGHKWLWLSRIGGKPMLAIVTEHENFADMAPSEPNFFEFVTEQMGSAEEADAVFTEFGSGFASSDYTVWMFDPDLSTPADDSEDD
ncbi:MAG: hypothetical protein OEU90_08595 [Gammaproteobacteria bacterium]|jgi:hypothetical protein|nr:hypothetical protein [Gammaproteobacteria bacterium]MDH3752113.1 hypothetical protein [Gammaproteobacteria bacterium]MDH3805514.1 hypothetical protein [Gammaproteobacteria bacterium]